MKPEAPPEEAVNDAANLDTPADAVTAENVAEKPDLKQAYEAALSAYDSAVKKYESDLAAYDDKVKAGEKLVKDLNRRFADWYYVISGDSFENLRQGRKTLVKEKVVTEKPVEANPADEAK